MDQEGPLVATGAKIKALASFDAKLARAQEHLVVLQREVAAFVDDPNTYSVTKEVHPEKGVYEFRLNIPKEPPMDRWALIAGDCIHNARSALDHLYWQLVLIQHPDGKPRNHWRAGFPIYDDANRFSGKKGEIEYFVGATALAMIERLQPFTTEDARHDALNFLHKSDIMDKHRLLVPNVGYLEKGQIKATQRRPPDDVRVNRFMQDRLHSGAVLATVVVIPPESVADVNLISMRLGIVFTPSPGKVIGITTALADLIDTVRTVPDKLPSCFPRSARGPEA